MNRDSGKIRGKRRIRGGRAHVRTVLLNAMVRDENYWEGNNRGQSQVPEWLLWHLTLTPSFHVIRVWTGTRLTQHAAAQGLYCLCRILRIRL